MDLRNGFVLGCFAGCLLSGACGGRAYLELPDREDAASRGGSGAGRGGNPWSAPYYPSGGQASSAGYSPSLGGTVGIVEPSPPGGMASFPTEPPPASHCEDVPGETLPIVVTERYSASGYYDSSWQELSQAMTPCPDRPVDAAGECLSFSWAPSSLTWVGLQFQYPANNWDGPGLCIEDGATEITFFARGEVGGEAVAFDAVGASVSVVLTSSWTRYSIDLGGVDYNDYSGPGVGVRGGFSIVLTRAESDVEPKKLYIDDVRWVRTAPGAGGSGGTIQHGGAGGAEAAGAGGATDAGESAGAGGSP